MCGIVAVAEHAAAAQLAQLALLPLQHRGQESAGIAAWDGGLARRTGMGLVAEALATVDVGGRAAIGHTRYSTTGASRLENAQPLRFEYPVLGSGAVAHNGNLTDAADLRARARRDGRAVAVWRPEAEHADDEPAGLLPVRARLPVASGFSARRSPHRIRPPD